jgi:hypothetical protein
MATPSKDEIRKKYKISQEEFEILTTMPTPTEMMVQGVKVEKLGFWGKFEVWKKSTILGGIVAAVCFIGDAGAGVDILSRTGEMIYGNSPQIAAYAHNFAHYAGTSATGFFIQHGGPPENLNSDMAEFATGTVIYPASRSYRGPKL